MGNPTVGGGKFGVSGTWIKELRNNSFTYFGAIYLIGF